VGIDYDDFEEDIDDIGDGDFKDETIGYREGFRQPRNRRDFMYFDEVLLLDRFLWSACFNSQVHECTM